MPLVLERGTVPGTSPAALGQLVLMSRLPTFLVAAADAVLPSAWAASSLLPGTCGGRGVRAIHAALPLLTQAERVVLLQGPLRASYAEGGWRPASDIGAYFRRHDLSGAPALEGATMRLVPPSWRRARPRVRSCSSWGIRPHALA